jgi:hypothetical protein
MNLEYVWGPLNLFLVLLFSVLLRNFSLYIMPILSDMTIDCTHPEADWELVTLFSVIIMDLTQGHGEGESSLYLDQTLVNSLTLLGNPWINHQGACTKV